MSRKSIVAESYHHVRRISRQSGSNFYRSFWLLPRPKREAMEALYAFARITDDLGDSNEPPSVRSQWLQWWRGATALNLISENDSGKVIFPEGWLAGDQPLSGGRDSAKSSLRKRAEEIFPALSDTARRYEIPSRFLLEIIDGVLADQQKTRFDTYEQVEHYCYLVASAVGLACLHIWEFDEPLPTSAAIDCGLAFQWTNILRDVAEDAERGRIYLPRQHYEQHGLSEDDLLRPRRDDRLECLISEEASRAAKLFDSGWGIWDSLHCDGKPMFSMMWRTYRKLLKHIEDDPGQVLQKRVRLTRSEKISLVSKHYVPWVFRRLPVPPSEVGASG
jgi:phytoene synthase